MGTTAGEAEEGATKRAPMPIVAIEASAGGLEALKEFFAGVPPDCGFGFVVVTHIRAGRDSMLPELLGAVTTMKVIHAEECTPVRVNQVVVARDSLLGLSKGVIRPVKPDNGQGDMFHPIDHFFRSLAEDQQEHAIGIILSGSGNDGSVGLSATWLKLPKFGWSAILWVYGDSSLKCEPHHRTPALPQSASALGPVSERKRSRARCHSPDATA